MNINGKPYRTLWLHDDAQSLVVIDQRKLPHRFETQILKNTAQVAEAIQKMTLRGAPLIGVSAAYGMALAIRENPAESSIRQAAELLKGTRPTAVNLAWAVTRMLNTVLKVPEKERQELAYQTAADMADEDARICESIGNHGLAIIEKIAAKKGDEPVNILTHCNAGWLATVDWGTAIAPIYKAHDKGIKVHVWVDETRPRNQGASLTAWELMQHGVPMKLLADNHGGHLMQHQKVDACFVGTDRTTATGDVCNKIGTYLKALAAWDNDIPFYVCLPTPTVDWTIRKGLDEIPIEVRSGRELSHLTGKDSKGELVEVQIYPDDAPTENYAFDVTPSRYVTGLITEKGIFPADEAGMRRLKKCL